jgi:D-alanyl-lipoteichoic acid acyltransferase DltB (MBOAT superfamily)
VLFSSYIFVLVFLPVTWLGYRLIAERTASRIGVTLWLLAASLVFYGYWDWRFVPLLLASIAANWLIGRCIDGSRGRVARLWLTAGIGLDLALLGFFKYANFFAATVETITDTTLGWPAVLLPVGISFFTFQQIAYLVDIYRRETVERDPWRYALFVTFFPQLIAGPIVHHREMMPQIGRQPASRQVPDLTLGIVIFAIGLAKKVIIADGIGALADPMFDAAAVGAVPGMGEAWAGAFAYGFQIYFDFSGYADMAVGLGRMFGIALPVNFAAPYRATSIIDFWQRWHITLSRFLRDYLYIPMGGSRRGEWRRYRNIFVTMALGGIWHGAGWTFLLWGVLHGLFITANHAWRQCWPAIAPPPALGRAVTFLLVTIAWVPFRAADLGATLTIYAAMAGLGPAMAPTAWPLHSPVEVWLYLTALLAFVWLLPTSTEIMAPWVQPLATPGYPTLVPLEGSSGLFGGLRFRPTAGWAMAIALLLATCLIGMDDDNAFIYFQF